MQRNQRQLVRKRVPRVAFKYEPPPIPPSSSLSNSLPCNVPVYISLVPSLSLLPLVPSLMASSSFSIHPNFFFSLMLAFLLIPSSQGHDYFVGDSQTSWTLPRPYPEFLSHWAHRLHFKVGDTLVWKYDSKSESVLEVKEEDYKSCNIKNPISKHNDGDTKVELNRTGSFYFISGTDGHCHRGLRLDLVVHAGHHHRGNGHRPPTPVSKTVLSLSPASAHSPRGDAAPPKTNGAAALGCGGGGLFVGLVTGLGVTLLVTVT